MAKYKDLTINQKINFKSGWDIAIAKEGTLDENGKVYCKLSKCISFSNININWCRRDYNDQQKHRFLNGGRTLIQRKRVV